MELASSEEREKILNELRNYHYFSAVHTKGLDGRYFNLVLGEITQTLVDIPCYLTYSVDNDDIDIIVNMDGFNRSKRHPNVIRVIIQSNDMRSSAILILNPIAHEAYFWNPRVYDSLEMSEEIFYSMEDFVKLYFDYPLIDLRSSQANNLGVAHLKLISSPPEYCIAYILKFVIDLLANDRYDLSNINKFAAKVESLYSHSLQETEPDIEYGFSPGGALLGGGTGLLLGTAAAGPVGGLALGTTGALLGGAAFGHRR